MAGYEEYIQHILVVAPETEAPGDYYSLKAFVDSERFGIPEAHIRQLVIEMWQKKMVSLAIFDGQMECTLQEWRNRGLDDHSFFYNTTKDSNQVRVRLLAFGAMQRASLKKTPIGFSAPKN